MQAQRWGQVQELFHAALEQAEDRRAGWLDENCADPELRQEVDSLLASHHEATAFIDRPAVDPLALAANGEADEPAIAGRRIGPYELVRLLGRGGMGAVFLAFRADDTYRKQVAIKLLERNLVHLDLERRFLSERQILANLDHPGIAKLLDGGATQEGAPYLVMDFVDGLPITQFCRHNQLNVEERLRLFVKVCAAVAFSHRNLVVHRDIKPGNILVAPDGEPKLLDFGIAKLLRQDDFPQTLVQTQSGVQLMTPSYASPEQILGEAITTATDVYSLAVLLNVLLTGQLPYRLDSAAAHELTRAVCEQEPRRPSASVSDAKSVAEAGIAERASKLERRLAGDLDTIVLMALRKEPSRRYPSVEALAGDVQRHLAGLPVGARKDTLVYRTSKFFNRHRLSTTAAAAALTLLLVLLASLLLQRQKTLQQRDRAGVVSQFMIDLYEIADPTQSKGESITAREVLDNSAGELQQLSGQPEIQASLMETLAKTYLGLGLYEPARELLFSALANRRELHSKIDPRLADTLEELGRIETLQANHGKAEEHLQEALVIRRRRLGKNPQGVVSCLHKLASLYQEVGRFEEAEKAFQESIELIEPTTQERIKLLGTGLDALGSLKRQLAQFEAAEELHRRTIKLMGQITNRHPLLAGATGNLATALQRQGRYEEAEEVFRDAIDRQRHLYPEGHPLLATTLTNLATMLRQLHRFAEAESLFQEALELRRQLYSEGHPAIAYSLDQLGELRIAQGRFDEAEEHFTRSLKIRRERFGAGHIEVAESLSRLAGLRYRQEDFEAAQRLYREALEIYRAEYGDTHTEVATVANNLSRVYSSLGQFDRAEAMYRQSLEVFLKILGPSHPTIATLYHNLGVIQLKRKNLFDARQSFNRAYQLAKEKLGEQHGNTLTFSGPLVSVLLRLGEFDEAESVARRSLLAASQTPANPQVIADQERALGLVLLRQHRYREAEAKLLQGLDRLLTCCAEQSAKIERNRRYLRELYTALGRPNRAREFAAAPGEGSTD